MSDTTPAKKGNRKVKVTRENSLMILLAFIISCMLHPPVELFVAFIVGIGGTAFSFMWGNSKEHAAAAVLDPAPKP
jgi:hypothetical protein